MHTVLGLTPPLDGPAQRQQGYRPGEPEGGSSVVLALGLFASQVF